MAYFTYIFQKREKNFLNPKVYILRAISKLNRKRNATSAASTSKPMQMAFATITKSKK